MHDRAYHPHIVRLLTFCFQTRIRSNLKAMRLLVVSPLTYRHCFKLQLANPLETSHLTSMLKHLEPDALGLLLDVV